MFSKENIENKVSNFLSRSFNLSFLKYVWNQFSEPAEKSILIIFVLPTYNNFDCLPSVRLLQTRIQTFGSVQSITKGILFRASTVSMIFQGGQVRQSRPQTGKEQAGSSTHESRPPRRSFLPPEALSLNISALSIIVERVLSCAVAFRSLCFFLSFLFFCLLGGWMLETFDEKRSFCLRSFLRSVGKV